MLSDYQQELRDRLLAAPVTAPPPPWTPVLARLPLHPLHPARGRILPAGPEPRRRDEQPPPRWLGQDLDPSRIPFGKVTGSPGAADSTVTP